MTDTSRRPQSRADRRREDRGAPDGKERRREEVRPVRFEIRNEPEGLVVALTNALVVNNCFAVRDRLHQILDNYTTRTLYVDLSGVPYADTAGLGMLVEMRGRWRRDGRDMVLRNPTPRVHQVIRVLQMDRNLAIEHK